MNRRTFLTGAVCLGVGASGYALYSGEVDVGGVASGLGDATGPPETDTEIASTGLATHGIGDGPLDRMVFYESGAAEVHFNTGHDFDRFGITHTSLNVLEDSFNVWDAPDYKGPVVVNLKRTIVNNGPYPNNEFTIGYYDDPEESIYLGDDTAEFSVPTAWYNAAQSRQ